jgi:tyrosyl-tRNA synthetase
MAIMALSWYQRFGNRPIALAGGGTTLIGDPTGRQQSRPILSADQIARNMEAIRPQMTRFLDFSEGKALLVNNADWLVDLNYVDFMREVGSRFTVNQILDLEAYRTRLEAGGLTFLEFSYVLLQSFDFLRLFQDHQCILQIGGSDQWGNSIAGMDLIRRVTGAQAFVEVSPLVTTGSGVKMGKSESGALWLDRNMTTPFEYFQYWRNVDDGAVGRCLAAFTYLPMDEVRRLGALEGADRNLAKETLAFEATRLLHGEEDALKAREAASALFQTGDDSENAPTWELDRSRLEAGIRIVDLAKESGLVQSTNEARSLIQQGGLSVDGQPVADVHSILSPDDLTNGRVLLRAGRKRFIRVVAK